MEQEALNFKVSLSGVFWEKRPAFSIWLDNEVVVQSEMATNPHYVNFSRTVNEGEHTLSIRLDNKTAADTVIEHGEIIKDLLLNINDIEIDDISLGQLLWSAEYILDTPQQYQGNTIDHLDHCVNLGWNGTYKLTFTSPFYLWLLEKL